MMNRRIFAFFCILILAISGCAQKEPESSQAMGIPEEQPTRQAAIFTPDKQSEYLQGAYITVNANDPLPAQLIAGLANAKALPEDVEILDCQFLFVDGKFELNLNDAFLTALQGIGSAGEAMMIYSVVNTFLFNYPTANALILTVDGSSIETEHGDYSKPFTELGCLRQ